MAELVQDGMADLKCALAEGKPCMPTPDPDTVTR